MITTKLTLFGPPRLVRDGQSVAVSRRKALALLVYLAATGQPHSRDALATLFWPEVGQRLARSNLRRALSDLNRELGEGWLALDGETVALAGANAWWSDVAQFRNCMAACAGHNHPPAEVCAACLSLLMEAAELYQADFLAGFTLRDAAGFDDWQYFEAESLRQALASALEKLTQLTSAQKDDEAAIAYARRRLALDPLHEPAQQALMRLYHQAGHSAAALRQYELYVALLAEEMGLPPTEETTALYEAMKANRRVGSPPQKAAAPNRKADNADVSDHPAAHRHNLPSQPTPFVGREQEVAAVSQLLTGEPDCRLLTLVGPGGIGKTRLALQAAAVSLSAFADGLAFVPLAAVAAPDNLAPSIANSLNLALIGATDLQAHLIDYLREKQCLLLLDNFEHLIAGADLLSAILAEAPAVKMLVTSRERLRLQAEWIFDVQGLAFPDRATQAPEEPYAAVTLFEQSARRAKARFAPNQDDATAIARICRLVQGMPLAVELAAAWVNVLSCREIAVEIEQSLDFLAATLQDVPERQRSIRAVFQHSWQLTPEPARAVFAKLAVFRGGFTRDAAQQVAGASLLTLAALVDKSLVRRDANGRYEIHELLRQYGADQLRQHTETLAAVRRRHAAYFAGLLRQWKDAYYSGQREVTTAAINREVDNVRAAWQWAIEHTDYDTFGHAMMSLYFFYETQGWYREGEAAFHQAVTALQDSVHQGDGWERELRSSYRNILTTLGWFRFRLARYEETQALLQQSLPIYHAVQDSDGLWMVTELSANVAYSLGRYEEARAWVEQNLQLLQTKLPAWLWAKGQSMTNLGRVYTALGNYEAAGELLEEGSALLKQVGDRLGTILALHTLGRTHHALGRLTAAEDAYQAGLEIARANNLPLGEAVALNDLGDLAYQQGAFAKAKEHYLHCLNIYRAIGDRRGRALALTNLGLVDTALGDYREAELRFQQSLAICEQIRNRRGLALTLNYLSDLARIQGDYGRAQALNQASLRHCQEISYVKGIALALQTSGDLALDLTDYSHAEACYQQSLAIYHDIGFQEGRINCHIGLGQVARLLGKHGAAKGSFHQALADAADLQTIPKRLDVLVNLTDLLVAEGETAQALVIVALAAHHPASATVTQEKAMYLLQGLAAPQTPATVGVVRADGVTHTVETLTSDLLARWAAAATE